MKRLSRSSRFRIVWKTIVLNNFHSKTSIVYPAIQVMRRGSKGLWYFVFFLLSNDMLSWATVRTKKMTGWWLLQLYNARATQFNYIVVCSVPPEVTIQRIVQKCKCNCSLCYYYFDTFKKNCIISVTFWTVFPNNLEGYLIYCFPFIWTTLEICYS